MRQVASSIILAIWLTGCVATGDAPILTGEQTRAAVVTGKGRAWKDPDSLRDASIGEPYACMGAWQSATCVCVEANARNSFGGYAGVKPYMVTLVNGAVNDVREAHTTDILTKCNRMTPFPELTGGGLAVQPGRRPPK